MADDGSQQTAESAEASVMQKEIDAYVYWISGEEKKLEEERKKLCLRAYRVPSLGDLYVPPGRPLVDPAVEDVMPPMRVMSPCELHVLSDAHRMKIHSGTWCSIAANNTFFASEGQRMVDRNVTIAHTVCFEICQAADAHPLHFEDRYAFVLSTLMGEQTCFREKEVSIFVYLLACSNTTVPTLPCSLQLRFTGRPCEAGVFPARVLFHLKAFA